MGWKCSCPKCVLLSYSKPSNSRISQESLHESHTAPASLPKKISQQLYYVKQNEDMYWFCAQMIYAGILVLCPFHQKSELLVDNHLKGLSSHSSLVLKNILKAFYIFWIWFYSVIWKPWDKNLSQEIMSFLCLCLTSLWKFPKRRNLVQKSGKILGETLFFQSGSFISTQDTSYIPPPTCCCKHSKKTEKHLHSTDYDAILELTNS